MYKLNRPQGKLSSKGGFVHLFFSMIKKVTSTPALKKELMHAGYYLQS